MYQCVVSVLNYECTVHGQLLCNSDGGQQHLQHMYYDYLH